ncbi:hypothetical protein [Corynebacterium sp. H130]|uniref:hypothetical protein n=1 Tax=Corynebacterium sp. H130 TaxID=3133444 RepID=UPI00309EA0BC
MQLNCTSYAPGHRPYHGHVFASTKNVSERLLPFRVTLIDGQMFQATIDQGGPLWFWMHRPEQVAELFQAQSHIEWGYDYRYDLIRPLQQTKANKIYYPRMVPVGDVYLEQRLREMGPCE